MKRYNVVRPKKYTSHGEEKTVWLQVGTITQFDNGGLALELNHTSERLMVFEQKPREQGYQNRPQPQVDDEIKVEDIQF